MFYCSEATERQDTEEGDLPQGGRQGPDSLRGKEVYKFYFFLIIVLLGPGQSTSSPDPVVPGRVSAGQFQDKGPSEVPLEI